MPKARSTAGGRREEGEGAEWGRGAAQWSKGCRDKDEEEWEEEEEEVAMPGPRMWDGK